MVGSCLPTRVWTIVNDVSGALECGVIIGKAWNEAADSLEPWLLLARLHLPIGVGKLGLSEAWQVFPLPATVSALHSCPCSVVIPSSRKRTLAKKNFGGSQDTPFLKTWICRPDKPLKRLNEWPEPRQCPIKVRILAILSPNHSPLQSGNQSDSIRGFDSFEFP